MEEALCVGGGGGWAVDVQHTFLFYGTTTCSWTPFSLLLYTMPHRILVLVGHRISSSFSTRKPAWLMKSLGKMTEAKT
eukprot:SAG22_NODE_2267_length_2763_cov_3.832584_3_plen_78_part_00